MCFRYTWKTIDQLSANGKMIVPIGDQYNEQKLQKITKNNENIEIQDLGSVRFVPLLEGKESK